MENKHLIGKCFFLEKVGQKKFKDSKEKIEKKHHKM